MYHPIKWLMNKLFGYRYVLVSSSRSDNSEWSLVRAFRVSGTWAVYDTWSGRDIVWLLQPGGKTSNGRFWCPDYGWPTIPDAEMLPDGKLAVYYNPRDQESRDVATKLAQEAGERFAVATERRQ